MVRMATAWALGGWILSSAAGCSHFLEARSIAQFTAELDRGNLDGLRSSASSAFERKALRDDDALGDLRILNLPTEKPTIVEVQDSSETEKLVEVQVGESGRRLLYRLVRAPDSNRWVVDDIYVRQKHKGVTATRSVTEQMDLLLTVREFLKAAGNGDRDGILGVATQEFGQVLGELPPPYLAALSRRLAGQTAERESRPEATVDHNVAEVTIPRRGGRLAVSCRLEDGHWKVADISLESRTPSERIPSARVQAGAVLAAVRFLDTYSAGDKQALGEVCAPNLYRSLRLVDLGEVKLPDSRAALPRHEMGVIGPRAEFQVTGNKEILKLSLERPAIAGDEPASSAAPFLVQNVTLYQLDGSQERRLSAVFTARPVMEIFAEAIAHRDLEMLRKLSTTDFRERLWDRLDAADLEDPAFDLIATGEPRVVGTNYCGPLTEITVVQGTQPMTYVLQDIEGSLNVDDVLIPAAGRPESLKKTMEILLPVRAYAEALAAGEIDRLQRNSSDDFKRLVWGQVREVPPTAQAAVLALHLPLARVEKNGETEMLVVLGDDRRGAEIALVVQHGRRVVDDVRLVVDGQAAPLKSRLRQELADRMFAASRASSAQPPPHDRGVLGSPVHQRPSAPRDATADGFSHIYEPFPTRDDREERIDDARLHTLRSDELPLIEISPAGEESAGAGRLPSVPLDPALGELPLR